MSAFDFERELESLRAEGLLRRRKVADSACGPELTVDGKAVIAFCSNDYLGLAAQPEIAEAVAGADAVVLAVGHREYLDLNPDQILEMAGRALAVIDCFGILNDDMIRRYFELGCEVKGLGRGHVKRIKDEVRGN